MAVFTIDNATTVFSGTPTAPAPIESVGTGAPPDGYSINLNTGFQSRLYKARVVAQGQANAQVELEAKFAKLDSGGGGY